MQWWNLKPKIRPQNFSYLFIFKILINHWLLSMISFCLRVISVIFLISMHLTGSTWHLGHQSSFRNIAIVINDFQKYKAIFSDFFSGILTIETQNLGNYFHNNQFPAYIFQTFLWQFWIPRFLNFSFKSSHLRYWRVKIDLRKWKPFGKRNFVLF